MSAVTALLRWGTLALWAFWLVHYWGGPPGLRRHFRNLTVGTQSWLDRAASTGISLFTLALVALALLSSLGQIAIDAWVVAWPGALFTLGGLLGTYACRSHLGRFWTPEASLLPDHQVVDEGPYALVRHPIYAMTLLMYLGITVAFSAWVTWGVFALLAVSYVGKAYAEERVLSTHLPAYQIYRQRVRHRLIPRVW